MFKRYLIAITAAVLAFASAQTTLRIGVSPVPHGDILEFVKPILAAEGIDIEIVEFTDYVQPNLALSAGDLDANYFQHVPYLERFSADHGLKLVSLGGNFVAPIGIYSSRHAAFDDLPNGARIVELEAPQLPRALEDIDAAAINTNYALEASLNLVEDALLIEGADSPYVNVVAGSGSAPGPAEA